MKKKQKILVISILSITLFISLVFFSIKQNNEKINATLVSKNINEISIILDPGHGGFDSGAISPYNKILEKDINLNISIILKKMLEENGFKVIMTREEDKSTEKPDDVKRKSKKKSDMYNRLELLNSSENNIFISIHQNTYKDSSSHGSQIFYGPKNTLSKKLAQNIQDSISLNLQKNNNKEIVKAKNNLFLLYKANVPAILIECGFLTNKNDLELLQNEEYIKKLSQEIINGLQKFLNEN